ncbi:hypothetical protein CNR22_14125 [Sphingobacteriaceae bacterium]|nr:hypothetical protein CNR22_14125 [Sphingobacteriaceae bacterium]
MFPFSTKKIIFIFFSMLMFYSGADAQVKLSKKDKAKFVEDSMRIMRPRLVRPQFRLDNRNLFYQGQVLNVSGVDAGVLLKNKLRLCIGYYSLSNNLNSYEKTIDNVKYERSIKLQYGSINTEVIYKNTRYLSLGMPLEFAFGNNTLEYKNSETGELSTKKAGFVVSSDFGLSATFKPIRWIGLKGIVGYRKTLFNAVKDFRFDGLFTSIGLNVDVREIIKDIQMFSLKRKYKRGNTVENAVDLITD